MKKPLNEQAITNELRGGSVFFRPPSPSAPLPESPDHADARPPVRSTPPADRSTEMPARADAQSDVRRVINRHAFEIYQDQLETLRRMSLEGQLAGEKISMSEMVREALDTYIDRKRRGR